MWRDRGQAPGYFWIARAPPWDSVFLLTCEIYTLREARVRPPRPPPPPHSTQKLREKAPGWAPSLPPSEPPQGPAPPRTHQGYLSRSEERGARRWEAPGQEPTNTALRNTDAFSSPSFPAHRGSGRRQPMGVKPLQISANEKAPSCTGEGGPNV